MHLWSGVFQFGTIFSVTQGHFRCISVSSPFSRPCNSFSCYLSIPLFCYVLSIPIFYSKIVLLPLHPVVTMSSSILWLFWNILFWLYYLTLSLYLLTFPSFANIFWFVSLSWIVWFACSFVWVFSFQHIPMIFPFLTTSLVLVISLAVLQI